MSVQTALLVANLLIDLVGIVPLIVLLWWRRSQVNTERVVSVAYESGMAEGRATITLGLLTRLQGAENVEAAVQAWMREELTVLDLEQKPSYMDLMIGDHKSKKVPRHTRLPAQ